MYAASVSASAAACFLLAGGAFAEEALQVDRWIVPPYLRTIDQAFDATKGAPPTKMPIEGNEFGRLNITAIDSLFRARMIFKAPADGEYRFAIAGDDLARLYFSTDAAPLKKRLIAKLDGYTGPRSWKTFPTQISEPVTLAKGESRYLEAQCFNQGGGGHFEVGWMPPGTREIQQMPLKTADGSALLSPYEVPASDSDDDELPDDWEREKGLEVGKNRLHGADGDPDGDSITNRQEFLAGTDPLKGDVIPGAVRAEVWAGRGDSILEQLFSFGVHLLPLPAPSVKAEKSIAVVDFATPGFQRNRGFIVPPESGMYRFHLEGQGMVSMDLSPDDNALKRKRILRGGSVLSEIDPDQVPPGLFPSSEPVFLKQGERRFFETVLYQYKWKYFLKLEWTRPDGVREPVPMSVMQSYVSPFTDADQDDLPDDWEKAKGLDVSGSNAKHFATGDPDFDGADNAAEFLAKTDPLKADSDGDGVSDGEEIKLLGTDPLKADNPLGERLAIDLFSAEPLSPAWSRAEPQQYESHRKMPPPMPDDKKPSLSVFRGYGSIRWKFQVDEPGFHLLRFPIHPVSSFTTHEIGICAEIRVDGKRLPEIASFGAAMALQRVSQVTPWLSKGEHTVQLRLSPAFMPTMTRVFGIEVLPVKAGDATEAVKRHLAATNLFTGGIGKSLTSPVTITFQGRGEDSLKLTAGEKVTDMKAVNGTSGWADSNLPEDGKPLALQVASEGGAVITTAECAWAATNVLELHHLTLRAGDSLRLTAAAPEADAKGQATLEIAGQTKKLAAGETWVKKFEKAGKHQVKGRFEPPSGEALEGTLEITVIAPPAGMKPVLARVGSATTVPALPDGLSIDGGDVASITSGEDGKLWVSPRIPGDFQLPIRVKDSGAVAGMIALKGFRIHIANEPYWTGKNGQQPPGRLVHVVMENLPDEATVRMSCKDPDLYLPYAEKEGNSTEFPVRAIGPEGLATIHVRAVKDAYQWLRTELQVTMPDGRQF